MVAQSAQVAFFSASAQKFELRMEVTDGNLNLGSECCWVGEMAPKQCCQPGDPPQDLEGEVTDEPEGWGHVAAHTPELEGRCGLMAATRESQDCGQMSSWP